MDFSLAKNVQTDFWEVYKKHAWSLYWKIEKWKKTQISQYLLGIGAAVVIIGVWVVSATKMIKQTTESKSYNLYSFSCE